jgi:hypothetical protein
VNKPHIPDERIKEILAMLADGKKWDAIEYVAHGRPIISKVRNWYNELPLLEALAFAGGNIKIIRLRQDYLALSSLSQRKQLSDFFASLSLPSPFLIWSENFLAFLKGSAEAMTSKLNRGIRCLCYKPALLGHPLFSQAKEVFKQETLWTELEHFEDDFNKLLAGCTAFWHDIYQDARQILDATEAQFPSVTNAVAGIVKEVHDLQDNRLLSTTKVTPSLSSKLNHAYYRFIPVIYEDAVGWALGKNLTNTRREDYDYGSSGEKQFVVRYQLPDRLAILIEFLHEDKNMGFKLAASIRDVHMTLREKYRQSDRVKNLAEAMYRLEAQRVSTLQSLKQLATVLK